jgi:hypothetical protein
VIRRFAAAATAEAYKERVFNESKTMITQVQFRMQVSFARFFNDLFAAFLAGNSAFVVGIKEVFAASATMQVWMNCSASSATFFTYVTMTVWTFCDHKHHLMQYIEYFAQQ